MRNTFRIALGTAMAAAALCTLGTTSAQAADGPLPALPVPQLPVPLPIG
ncbi:MAG: hypothetical protein ACT4QG_12850 [Sporichthyaceae bacterium]